MYSSQILKYETVFWSRLQALQNSHFFKKIMVHAKFTHVYTFVFYSGDTQRDLFSIIIRNCLAKLSLPCLMSFHERRTHAYNPRLRMMVEEETEEEREREKIYNQRNDFGSTEWNKYDLWLQMRKLGQNWKSITTYKKRLAFISIICNSDCVYDFCEFLLCERVSINL